MKDFRNYIKENRDLLDTEMPPDGHFERFEALLAEKEEQKAGSNKLIIRKKGWIISFISAAACIALIVGIAFHLTPFGQKKENKTSAENDVKEIYTSEEFMATNEFYESRMNEQINDIMCKLAQTNSENQAQLTKDIQNIIDSNKDFIKDIANNEDEGLAIHFLVKHYETNIQVLENINEKLGKYAKC